MTAVSPPIFEPAEMFSVEPDWIDNAEIPTGTTFYTRRGLPYLKKGTGWFACLWDNDVEVDDDESVFADWPYWSADSSGVKP